MLDVMILCIQCDFEQLNISCLYKFSFHLPSCVGRVFSGVCVFVCLSVWLFFQMISQKPMQLGSPNLTRRDPL